MMLAREMIFRRALLQLLAEQCKKPRFETDVDVFTVFLGLTRDIVKDNSFFREHVDCKSAIYLFIETHFCKLLDQVRYGELLLLLIEPAVLTEDRVRASDTPSHLLREGYQYIHPRSHFHD